MPEIVTIEIADAEQMTELGRSLGRLLAGGEIVALSGPLGAGKTQLTKGIALGLDVPAEQPVTSPTFVLIRSYDGRLTLHHCDAYRLGGFDELLDLGWDELAADEGAVVVLEWADRFPELQASQAWWVTIEYADLPGRRVAICPPDPIGRQDLTKALKTTARTAPDRKNAPRTPSDEKHG